MIEGHFDENQRGVRGISRRPVLCTGPEHFDTVYIQRMNDTCIEKFK